jgi:hypothetical protein
MELKAKVTEASLIETSLDYFEGGQLFCEK